MCLSGLKMGVTIVCTLKIDGKHDCSLFLHLYFPEANNKTQLSFSRHAREVVGDVFSPILVSSLKFCDVTNL